MTIPIPSHPIPFHLHLHLHPADTNRYELSWAGFSECFTKAWPFFYWQIVGDLGYTFVMFGAHYALTHYVPRFADEKTIPAHELEPLNPSVEFSEA